MSEQINPLDLPGEAFEVELLNPNPSSRRTKDGPVYRLSFEVTEKVHSAFMNASQSNLRLVGFLSVLPDTDEQIAHEAIAEKMKRRKKEPEIKGAFGQLWRHLYTAGFANAPGVKETLEEVRRDASEEPVALLRRIFGVEGASLTMIGPEEIYAEFPPNEYPAVKVMVEQARKKALAA